MCSTCSEIHWLQGLLSELDFPKHQATPLHADNTSDIQIVANLVFHEHIRHIEVDFHFTSEAFDQNIITLPHVSSNIQNVDIFTKVMTHTQYQFEVGYERIVLLTTIQIVDEYNMLCNCSVS